MNERDERNIRIVRLMYTGDTAEQANIAPDIVWHVLGHNPVSGEYHGFGEYTHLIPARMAPLRRWEFDLEDVMVNGDYVVATWTIHGERKDQKIDLHGAHIMRLNQDGQIIEGWGFTKDQDSADAFFAA